MNDFDPLPFVRQETSKDHKENEQKVNYHRELSQKKKKVFIHLIRFSNFPTQ
jgi:hypothetical protein